MIMKERDSIFLVRQRGIGFTVKSREKSSLMATGRKGIMVWMPLCLNRRWQKPVGSHFYTYVVSFNANRRALRGMLLSSMLYR